MKRSSCFLSSAILLGFALWQPQAGWGQTSVSLQVTDPTNAVWDISRVAQLQHISIDIEKNSGAGAKVDYDDPFVQTGTGKLKGSGPTEVSVSYRKDADWITVDPFAGTYVVNGSVTSTKGSAVITFSTQAQGRGVVNGKTRKVTAGKNFTIKIQAPTGIVSGRSSESASAVGVGTLNDHGTIEPEAIPAELGDGSWTLAMDFDSPVGNKLSGTGTVTLATGMVFPFKVTGNFAPKSGISKLTLKGTDVAKGSLLEVNVLNGQVTRVSGMVSGQKVKVVM